jgi:hypothetical protein
MPFAADLSVVLKVLHCKRFSSLKELNLRRVDGFANDLLVFCEQIFYKASIDYSVKLDEY